MTLVRSVRPEILDELAPSDPDARRSRRDLVRVHLAMGTRGIAARAWRTLLPDADGARPVRVLELGAGDGTLALAVAPRLAPTWPDVHLTLLDRQDVVADETREAFAALGWRCSLEIVDVLDWAARDVASGVPPWDLIATSLFLHHFEGDALARLIAAVAARTRAFHAFEPRRDRLALAGSRLIGALGTNAVTRSDAVTSVHAGFRDEELSALWRASAAPADVAPAGAVPADAASADITSADAAAPGWTLAEGRAGPFGHGFTARRDEAARP